MFLAAVAALVVASCLPSAVTTSQEVDAEGEWREVVDIDLQIREGSALDFSPIFADQPAIAESRFLAKENGTVRVSAPGVKPQKFLCAPMVLQEPHGGFPDREEADAVASHLRMAGYNLARLHFVDNALMKDDNGDFDFDPQQVDRFHYFLAALKNNGIYWMIDAATSWNGAYGNLPNGRWDSDDNFLQLEVHFREEARAHWGEMVDRILGETNPYTGGPILLDPALVAITTINEPSISRTLRRNSFEGRRTDFEDWLTEEYGTLSDSRRVEVLTGLERDTFKWMRDFLRDRGYRGLVTMYNNSRMTWAQVAPGDGDLVANHDYHDWPKGFIRPGATMGNESSIKKRGSYFRILALVRHANIPFIVDEYDHPYWSEWRREAGLVIPAYGALQNWDGICRFNNPGILRYSDTHIRRRQAIHPYAVGMDPIGRASEAIAALLFRRGDVFAAEQKIVYRLSRDTVFNSKRGHGRIPIPMGEIGLIHEIAVDISSINDAPSAQESSRQRIVELTPRLWSLPAARESSGLTKEQQINAARGIFISDTGQLHFDARRSQLEIRTEKTEAVAFSEGGPIDLGRLKLLSADVPAVVAASSLDQSGLEESNRILVVFSTDALNSGAKFEDGDRAVLAELGTLPVIMRTGRAELELAHQNPDSLKLYALALNGERREELELEQITGAVRFALDLGALGGPTPFFEIVRED